MTIIQHILNKLSGENGASSRAKINTLIDYHNDYNAFVIYDTAANFASANPVLELRQIGVEIDDLATNPKFKIGDNVTAWNDLPYVAENVKTVTGNSVNNSDPFNPIVESLGLIKIVDLAGDFFTDLATAQSYVSSFNISGSISDESFEQPIGATGGIYYFTVPKNANFSGSTYFLGHPSISVSAYIVDKLGLITSFSSNSFYRNSGNNILGNCSFGTLSFNYSTGNNILGNCSFGTNVFVLASGNNVLGNCSFTSAGFSSSSGNNILGNCSFGGNAFLSATGNNYLGNCTFGMNAFNNSSGKLSIGNVILNSPTNQFATSSSCEFIFRGNIGTTEGNNYSNFFLTNTATIRANRDKYSSNSGAIHGDLALAKANGASLFFGGIDKENVGNKVSNFNSPDNITYATTQATINLVDNRVQSNIKIIGDWDATSLVYPKNDESNTTPFISQWGATIKAGWAFRVGYGQAGTVAGFDYENGDVIYALIDNPSYSNSAHWGDLDHNLQQATESLRGTSKVITAAIAADETTTDDERYVTGKKLWLNFWTRVLAIAHTFAAKITFTTAPRFSSVSASQVLTVDANKDLSSEAKATAFNKNFGSSADTVLEGDKGLLKSNNLSDLLNISDSKNNLKLWNLYLTGGNQTNSTSTAANITGLSLTVSANKRYTIIGVIHIGCSGNGGVKFQITTPSGNVWLIYHGFTNNGNAFISATNTSSGTLTSSAFCTVAVTNGYLTIMGELDIAASAGTIQFGFASGTNGQTSTIYQLGTQLKIEEII